MSEYFGNYTSQKAEIFFAKVIEAKRSSKFSQQKKCKILDVVFMQRRVVLVVSETAVSVTSVGKLF